ncbi:hypothetical protein FPZ42_16000 [Mucilaginibacter achroorhodeus]|uniref:Ava_C0101 and related proteins n=1 Tax=Mucilaginibacter achroorhodeus TaxID=2599294 RepID=A0A563TZ08_9SPHI|nr:DUF5996 family protein [Mucilaginibacter achroorhodeus]TWR24598.1 hypothetical protein FPZ42_16000 [Mucilaginibacter achroorhodeus]
MSKSTHNWPVLDFHYLKDTIATVHMWTQMIGKVRLKKSPWINHSWQVTLYVSASGLTTGSITYEDGIFQIDLDLVKHQLHITTSTGGKCTSSLGAATIADFYHNLMDKLKAVGVNVEIYAVPNELETAIPFAENTTPGTYNAEAMHTLWQALVSINNVFTRFRAGFLGKCSPVHFFWGAFDLAVTRFSGRTAPKHPGGAPNMPVEVMQEAYSHEVSSCGFWPGSEAFPQPVFYSYCYPTPDEFAKQEVSPPQAFYSGEMGEFMLTYEVVQQSADPEATLLQFLQSTYDAAARTGNWDKNLECDLQWLKQ